MAEKRYNRRPSLRHEEAPMRVRPEVLAFCREEVEPSWKQKVRKLLRARLQRKYKLHAMGEGCHLGPNAQVPNLWLGDFTSFGANCKFIGPVVVGDLTMLSWEVHVVGQDHVFDRLDRPMRATFPDTPRPVTVIESDCWIGCRVTLMEGVRIGRGSVVGAGSIVTRSLPPYSLAVGSPARVIRPRFTPEEARQHDLYLYGKTFPEPDT